MPLESPMKRRIQVEGACDDGDSPKAKAAASTKSEGGRSPKAGDSPAQKLEKISEARERDKSLQEAEAEGNVHLDDCKLTKGEASALETGSPQEAAREHERALAAAATERALQVKQEVVDKEIEPKAPDKSRPDLTREAVGDHVADASWNECFDGSIQIPSRLCPTATAAHAEHEARSSCSEQARYADRDNEDHIDAMPAGKAKAKGRPKGTTKPRAESRAKSKAKAKSKAMANDKQALSTTRGNTNDCKLTKGEASALETGSPQEAAREHERAPAAAATERALQVKQEVVDKEIEPKALDKSRPDLTREAVGDHVADASWNEDGCGEVLEALSIEVRRELKAAGSDLPRTGATLADLLVRGSQTCASNGLMGPETHASSSNGTIFPIAKDLSRSMTRPASFPGVQSDFVVAVPSYQRCDTIAAETLRLLKKHGVPNEIIYIFVADSDEQLRYQHSLGSERPNIVVGRPTLCAQRNFITDYFDEDRHVVSIDDDVKEVCRLLAGGSQLEPLCTGGLIDIINDAWKKMHSFGAYLWSLNVTDNHYSLKRGKVLLTNGLCDGVLWGCRNRKRDDLHLRHLDGPQDVERTARYIALDGAVLRYQEFCAKRGMKKNSGSRQASKSGVERSVKQKSAIQTLVQEFPMLLKGAPGGPLGVKFIRPCNHYKKEYSMLNGDTICNLEVQRKLCCLQGACWFAKFNASELVFGVIKAVADHGALLSINSRPHMYAITLQSLCESIHKGEMVVVWIPQEACQQLNIAYQELPADLHSAGCFEEVSSTSTPKPNSKQIQQPTARRPRTRTPPPAKRQKKEDPDKSCENTSLSTSSAAGQASAISSIIAATDGSEASSMPAINGVISMSEMGPGDVLFRVIQSMVEERRERERMEEEKRRQENANCGCSTDFVIQSSSSFHEVLKSTAVVSEHPSDSA